jgi:hypothetical protein
LTIIDRLLSKALAIKMKEPEMERNEFWMQAFLASLNRVSPDEAEVDADRATKLCILSGRLEKKPPEKKSKWRLARNAIRKVIARFR